MTVAGFPGGPAPFAAPTVLHSASRQTSPTCRVAGSGCKVWSARRARISRMSPDFRGDE